MGWLTVLESSTHPLLGATGATIDTIGRTSFIG